jgi:RNase P subunit RPR2
VTREDAEPLHQTEDDIRSISGAGHQGDDKLKLLPTLRRPRCAKCKKFMGFSTGMHIMITQKWRVHIKCFSEEVDRRLEAGESIDMTTGEVIKENMPEDN